MNKPFISLCPEITRAHALTLMDWLEDERVTCYLSDSRLGSRDDRHDPALAVDDMKVLHREFAKHHRRMSG